jgi:GT2 family glycosyltransferase
MGPYLQEEKDIQFEERLKNLKPKSVINLKGFAMFLNIIKFKNIGFFDDSFFFYFEEIDLCKRLIDKGEKIYLIPEIKINHDGGKSHDNEINKEMELSRNWHWMWSTFTYHKKYKGFFISLVIIFPKLGSAAFKVLLYFLLLKKDKKEIYYHRLSGLFNAIVGKPSWYRPKV